MAASSSSSSILPPFYNQTETQNTAKKHAQRTADSVLHSFSSNLPVMFMLQTNKKKNPTTIYKLRQPRFVVCANVRSKGQDWEKRPDAAKQ